MLTGGRRLGGDSPRDHPRDQWSRGYFFAPTVFAGVKPGMRIAQEEVFGPVVSLIECQSFEDAIEISNGVQYGLSTALYSRDVNKALKSVRDLEAGITYINAPTIGAEVHLPFGGVKKTGNGHREGGTGALDFYTTWKSVYVDYSDRLQRAQIDNVETRGSLERQGKGERMIIGVPREVKDHESRVGITPAGVKALVEAGHTVLVETKAGDLSAFPDDEYQQAGAEIVGSAHHVWGLAGMIVKVKEPVEKEYGFFREDLVLFTYLHLAPVPALTAQLMAKKVIGIAYETIRDRSGALPLLTPMSEVAGRMSVQVGAAYLEKERGGRGLLLGGVPGVPPANVCVIGGGIVGTNAAKIALGMGAKVTIVDLNLNRLRELDDIFNGRVYTLASNSYNVARAVREADLVIGGVLIPGAAAPKVVNKEMVSQNEKGRRRGRRRNRPGGLHRDSPANNLHRPLLRGQWRRALLRDQYARRRSQHFHSRLDQCHISLCACAWRSMERPPPFAATRAFARA